jgi:hypothetical protein
MAKGGSGLAAPDWNVRRFVGEYRRFVAVA